MGFYDLPQAAQITIWVLVAIYAVFWLSLVATFATVGVQRLRERHPKLHQDGCVWILVLFGAFLISFLVPPLMLVCGTCVLICKGLCLDESQTCCGADWREPHPRKPTRKTQADPERGDDDTDAGAVGGSATVRPDSGAAGTPRLYSI